MKSCSLPPLFLAFVAGFLLAGAELAPLCAQRGGDRTPVVRYDSSSPTQRALATRIQAVSRDQLRLESSHSRHPNGTSGRVLDLTGQISAGPPMGSGTGQHLLVSLEHASHQPCLGVGVGKVTLLKCALLALPMTERVVFLYRRGSQAPKLKLPNWPRGQRLKLRAIAVAQADDLQAICAPTSSFRPDLVVLSEGAGLAALAPKMMAISAKLRVPVATNIPWLARSGSTLAVTPRLDMLARVFAHWLSSTTRTPVIWPGAHRRILNLDRWTALRQLKPAQLKAQVMAAFDVIIAAREGQR